MRVLVCDYSNQVREGFITQLIPAGYEVITVRTKKEVPAVALKKQIEILVLDMNDTDSEKDIMDAINLLRADNRFSEIKVILHISTPSKEFIVKALRMGVIGFLLKPFNETTLLQRFTDILKKAKVEFKERKHVRVKPDEKDNVTVTFRSPVSHKVISGKVVDISAGGVAFTLFGNVNEEEVQVRQFLNNFQIQINRTRATTPAIIIARKDKLCAVQYYKIQEYDLNVLCKYVYSRLATDIGE